MSTTWLDRWPLRLPVPLLIIITKSRIQLIQTKKKSKTVLIVIQTSQMFKVDPKITITRVIVELNSKNMLRYFHKRKKGLKSCIKTSCNTSLSRGGNSCSKRSLTGTKWLCIAWSNWRKKCSMNRFWK